MQRFTELALNLFPPVPNLFPPAKFEKPHESYIVPTVPTVPTAFICSHIENIYAGNDCHDFFRAYRKINYEWEQWEQNLKSRMNPEQKAFPPQ